MALLVEVPDGGERDGGGDGGNGGVGRWRGRQGWRGGRVWRGWQRWSDGTFSAQPSHLTPRAASIWRSSFAFMRLQSISPSCASAPPTSRAATRRGASRIVHGRTRALSGGKAADGFRRSASY